VTVYERDEALLALLAQLKAHGYCFVAPTPETHRRVVARFDKARAADLRDIFGWSRPFARKTLAPELFALLEAADVLRSADDQFRSDVRVASIGDSLFLHSAYPTDRADSVFLGPDSYRFVRFVAEALGDGVSVRRLVDIGAGSGVGAIMAARHLPNARLALTDINPLALRFARINARHNRVVVETMVGSGVEPVADGFDLAISNPPFIVDASSRAYRDGGAMHGAALSLDWALAAAAKLAPGGRMLLYTGSAIVAGEDRLRVALSEQLPALGCTLDYAEIDPDIFGEQLDEPGYEQVERIAAIGAVITRTGA
jgi:methylase of polypeptide subunit release factors